MFEGACVMHLMLEFVGLRAKMYALSKTLIPYPVPPPSTVVPFAFAPQRVDEQLKAKGLPKTALRTRMEMQQYRERVDVTLEQLLQQHAPAPTYMQVPATLLRSVRHEITTVTVVRRTLSIFDDTRHVLPCGRHTLAHGHRAITAAADGNPSCPWCLPALPRP